MDNISLKRKKKKQPTQFDPLARFSCGMLFSVIARNPWNSLPPNLSDLLSPSDVKTELHADSVLYLYYSIVGIVGDFFMVILTIVK